MDDLIMAILLKSGSGSENLLSLFYSETFLSCVTPDFTHFIASAMASSQLALVAEQFTFT
jgi:hypothetical protein